VILTDGAYQAVNVVGLDDTTLVGRPQLIQGKIEDIYGENAFIVVKDPEFPKLGNPHLGTEFELNEHRGVIVGLASVASSGLFGVPTIYTTYERALQYIPNPRFTISYLLIEPKTPADVSDIKLEMQALGYLYVPDRPGDESPDHDCDELCRGALYFGPDFLYICSGKPG